MVCYNKHIRVINGRLYEGPFLVLCMDSGFAKRYLLPTIAFSVIDRNTLCTSLELSKT
jgi:hypothetical protein